MDEGYTVDVIYLDIAKTLDSVNHIFILAKMKSFSLGDVVVRWIPFWTGLKSARRWRALGGHSYAQWCSPRLRDRPTSVPSFS